MIPQNLVSHTVNKSPFFFFFFFFFYKFHPNAIIYRFTDLALLETITFMDRCFDQTINHVG